MLAASDDHVAITDLLARYCLALDLDDVDAFVALFTPDASYEVFGRAFDGPDGLRRMMGAAPAGLHLAGAPVIEMLDGDRARSRQNGLFVERSNGTMRHSLYSDDLVRTAGGWRIARRRCQFFVDGGLSDRPD